MYNNIVIKNYLIMAERIYQSNKEFCDKRSFPFYTDIKMSKCQNVLCRNIFTYIHGKEKSNSLPDRFCIIINFIFLDKFITYNMHHSYVKCISWYFKTDQSCATLSIHVICSKSNLINKTNKKLVQIEIYTSMMIFDYILK
jgi:hypothetical protein